MKRSWFGRLILSYLPMFIIVVTFIFFVFFQIINEQGRKNAIQANNMLALHSMRIIDTALKTIDNMLLMEIANNQVFNDFLKSETNDNYYYQISAVKKLKELMAHYPLIDSIYLVRFKDQYVLSNATSAQANMYLDKAFIDSYERTSNQKWTGMRHFKQFSLAEGKNVVSLKRGVPFLVDNEGMIVVNIATSSLQRLIADLYDPSISYIQIKDNAGNIFFNEQDSTPKGAYASYKSVYSDWVFTSGFVNEQFMQNVFWLYNIWFIVGFIMIAIGLAWTIYISRRNARPVEQIVARINGYMLPSSGMRLKTGKVNEFMFIEEAFLKLSEQSKQFQQQYNEDLHLRTRNLFHQLIEAGNGLTLEEWREEAKLLQLPEPLARHLLFIMEIDKYGEFCNNYSRNDQNLLKFIVRSISNELSLQNECECWAEWTSSSRISVILFHNGAFDYDFFVQLCDSIRGWIELNTKFTVTVALGESGLQQAELSLEHKQISEALDYKIVLGENRLIMREDIQNQAQIEVYAYLGMIRSAANEFKKNNSKWRDSLEAMFTQLKQGLLTKNEINNILSYLLYSFGNELSGLGKDYQAVWEDESLPIMGKILETLYSIEDIHLAVISELARTEEKLASLRYTGQFADMVKEIGNFIEKNYADPNLSLDYLSSKYDMNAKYISKLFKDTMGEKFIDFLIGVRVKEAKKLLLITDYSVQDIASQVGYVSVVSFTRAFKKVAGVSPGEYRIEAQRAKSG